MARKPKPIVSDKARILAYRDAYLRRMQRVLNMTNDQMVAEADEAAARYGARSLSNRMFVKMRKLHT